jgi:hypothetical protein
MTMPPVAPTLIRPLLVGLLTACSLSAHAERVIGYVRDAESQRYLYTEVHDQVLASDGSVQTSLTVYYDAQAKEIARKTLDYRQHRTVPLYRMDMPQQRYSEGIDSNKGQVSLFKQDQGQLERKNLPLGTGLLAADAGFNQLIIDQMPQLQAGERISFSLIAAGNLDSFRFRASKLGDTVLRGVPATRILVEPDSMLRWLVSPIELVYDSESRKLMSYKGLSNIINPDTGKVYKQIRISYGGPAPAEARWPGSVNLR